MPQEILTPAHWVYLAGIIVIIITMVCRANVVAPAILATFVTILAMTGDFAKAIEAVFFGPLTAARELFNIFLVISLMTALMNALRVLQTDTKMVRPFRHVMVNADAAFIILGVVSYVMALFFWPTPSIPLIAGILLPAAIYAGVPSIAAAVCIAIAGLGTALSSDYIIKVAPGISAKAAGVAMMDVSDKALVLSLITGGVAFVLAYLRLRPTFVSPDMANLTAWEDRALDERNVTARSTRPSRMAAFIRNPWGAPQSAPANALPVKEPERQSAPAGTAAAGPRNSAAQSHAASTTLTPAQTIWSHVFAVAIPASFMVIVVYMILPKVMPGFKGPSGSVAAALVGGVAGLMMVFATAAFDVRSVWRGVASHMTEGFVFSFRAMGSVLPIAGFFFIGVAGTLGPIAGLPDGAHAPGLLADLVHAGMSNTPQSPIFAGFSILFSGMVTGIDGSGFAGLPLTGALAGALGRSMGLDVSTLAAIGQMGSVWTGKTLCAWSALAAVAGFAREPVLVVVRNLILPVLSGLIVSTLFAILYW